MGVGAEGRGERGVGRRRTEGDGGEQGGCRRGFKGGRGREESREGCRRGFKVEGRGEGEEGGTRTGVSGREKGEG